MNWTYNRKELAEQPPESLLGFVYIICHKYTGKYYIGKKQFWKAIRRPPLKGKKSVRKCMVPSDWRNYWGSSKKFQEYVKQEGKDNFYRIIISMHSSKSMLAYEELIQQIKYDVLRDEDSFNGIINIRINRLKNE